MSYRVFRHAIFTQFTRANMSTSHLDTAAAIVTRRFNLADGETVYVYVWKPTKNSNVGYDCHYLITGLGEDTVSFRRGVDGMQALILALQGVWVALYYSEAYKSGQLTWLTGQDLGLPTVPPATEAE